MRSYLFIACLLLGAGTARAQTEGENPASPRQNVTYSYDAGTRVQSSGVRQVRRRIARIGGGGQRVIYPIIILGGPSLQGSGAAGLSPQEAALLRRLDRRLNALDERLYDLEGVPADRRTRPPSDVQVQLRDGRADRETVARVEQALLETGLFRTSNVNFEFDRSALLPVSENILNAVGEVLVKYPDLRIEIAGHTDSIGTKAYNQALSERRAQAVRTYLLQHFDIAPDRLVPHGYGESRPVATNANPTGRTLNRRVEFVVLNQ